MGSSMEAGGTQASVNQSFRRIPDRAGEMVAEQLEAIMHRGAISSDEKLTEELRVDPEELKTVNNRVKPEGDMKKRGSRRFARFLVAICIGVAGTLAWQSYGEAIKQIIATRAPELGWSPEAKQMIASLVQQLGWTKSPAGPENAAVQLSVPKTPQAALSSRVARILLRAFRTPPPPLLLSISSRCSRWRRISKR